MESKTWKWTATDKADLGPGPWQDEHDKEQWACEHTALACLIVRNQMGAWCGYVGVPLDHPKAEPLIAREDVDGLLVAHGGVNFAGPCVDHGEDDSRPAARTICHVRGEGDGEVHWLGFDCAHGGDIVPWFRKKFPQDSILMRRAIYRDVAYVKAQVYMLALQIAAILGLPLEST